VNRKKLSGIGCMLAAMAIGLSHASAAQKAEPEGPLTAAGEKLLEQYSAMLTALQAEIVKSVPKIEEGKKAAFLKAYAAEAAAKSAEDATLNVSLRAKDTKEKEAASKACQEAAKAFAQAQKDTLTAAKLILADVGKFLTSDKLDAPLIRCAVLANATPRGLAEFAQQGKQEAALCACQAGIGPLCSG